MAPKQSIVGPGMVNSDNPNAAMDVVKDGERLSTTKLRLLWMSLRPHHWVKNSLVFGALIFSRSMLDWHAVSLSVQAFLLFCLTSSSVYLLNDLRDMEADRSHPVKRLRPLAAGLVNPHIAGGLMMLLLVVSFVVAYLQSAAFGLVLTAYVLLNLFYSFGLKRVVILDVMVVAICFVLRAIAGAVAIGVGASAWLLLCTLMLALVVTFGKRRHELMLLQSEASTHRKALGEYSTQLLDMLMGISAAAAIVTYALYTMDVETAARVGSNGLVLTVPFVLYGVFRYLHVVHHHKDGGDPASLLITDRPIVLDVILWAATACWVIYGWLPPLAL